MPASQQFASEASKYAKLMTFEPPTGGEPAKLMTFEPTLR